MYPIIKETMEQKKMTLVELSQLTGIRYQTLSEKLRGNNKISVNEAIAIKTALGTKLPIERLFAKEVTA